MRVLITVAMLVGGLTPATWAGGREDLRLSVQPVRSTVSAKTPAELKIGLVNTSQHPVWVEKRLVLGYHIDVFVLDKQGRPILFVYPRFTLVLPTKADFIRLQPGGRVEKSVEVTMDMLPDFAKKPGVWTFVVKVTIMETGAEFGLHGWKGTLKSHVKLTVR